MSTATKKEAFPGLKKPAAEAQPEQVSAEKAGRASGEIVRLSLRVPKKEWKLLHTVANDRETSINAMLLDCFYEWYERETGIKRDR